MIASWIRRSLYLFSGRLACRIISDGEHPYLERYFLFRAFGLTAYLHRFVGSDPDRGLHDHPWPWAFSVVLSGQYLERRRSGDRTVRYMNLLSGDTFHRVIMPPGSRSVWTLFVHSNARAKPWGFWHEAAEEGGSRVARWSAHSSSTPRDWWDQAPRGMHTEARQPADA
ncbi:MAG: hypothetical protein R3E83_10200 [Burkholderiaceae bacterium]